MVSIREHADPHGLRCVRSMEAAFEQREVFALPQFRFRREPGRGLATVGRRRARLHLHRHHRDACRWVAAACIGLIDAIDYLFLYG
jgi:hypothetical protein